MPESGRAHQQQNGAPAQVNMDAITALYDWRLAHQQVKYDHPRRRCAEVHVAYGRGRRTALVDDPVKRNGHGFPAGYVRDRGAEGPGDPVGDDFV